MNGVPINSAPEQSKLVLSTFPQALPAIRARGSRRHRCGTRLIWECGAWRV